MITKKPAVRQIKGLSLKLLVVAGVFLASLLVFWFIADEMVLEQENNLDRVVFQQLGQLVSPATTKLMLGITFFGSSYFLLPAYILLILFFLFFKKDRTLSLDVAAVGITSTLILFTLKAIFHRHRPLDPLVSTVNGFSFPSGHSFSSFTFFGLLIYIVWHHSLPKAWKWGLSIVFFLLACFIALSRVYLHVHYASDVIAGFFLCIVWLILSFWLIRKINGQNYFAANQ